MPTRGYIDVGTGSPLVLVPGVQGRWEWMAPAVEALGRHGRTVCYSLCGERGSECRLPPEAGFDAHVDQLARVLDRAGLERAAVCGVSYGGWIALRFAARHSGRVTALVLASTPGPGFRPDARQHRYVRAPRLLFPLFVIGSRRRLRAEVLKALPDRRARWRFTRRQLAVMAAARISPGLMARRVRLAMREDFVADCERVAVPTLIVTGEDGLDRIVPTAKTLEYLQRIRGARAVVVPHTGHLGLVTRPDEWAAVVAGFIKGCEGAAGGEPERRAP